MHLAGFGDVHLFSKNSIYPKHTPPKLSAFNTIKLPKHNLPENILNKMTDFFQGYQNYTNKLVQLGVIELPLRIKAETTALILISNKAPPSA